MTISKDITRIILVGIGVTSLAALILLAGPFIAIGDFRPFESTIVREIAIVLLVAGAAAFGGFKFYRRKKSANALATGCLLYTSGADRCPRLGCRSNRLAVSSCSGTKHERDRRQCCR